MLGSRLRSVRGWKADKYQVRMRPRDQRNTLIQRAADDDVRRRCPLRYGCCSSIGRRAR
jgi:hypothetical protein